MNDFMKWLVKTLGTAILWVFLLSINIKGRTVFSYANQVLVQNTLVQMVDEELSNLWHKVYVTAQRTFHEDGLEDAKERL